MNKINVKARYYKTWKIYFDNWYNVPIIVRMSKEWWEN